MRRSCLFAPTTTVAAAVVAFTVFASGAAMAQGSDLPPPPPPPPGSGQHGGGSSLPPPPPPPPSGSGSGAAAGSSTSNEPRSRRERRREEEASRASDEGGGGYGTGGAPPAGRGFQLGIRTGFAIPLGSVEENAAMSDAFGVQLPLLFDIGAKVLPNLFIGGYLGLGIGGTGGTTGDGCSRPNISCNTTRYRFGFQAQVHILPDQKVNPWVGYGFGYEIAGVHQSNGNNSTSNNVGGFELAHFMVGVDVRISKVFGIGPVLDFTLAQYRTRSTSVNGASRSNDIDDPALHQWFMLGVRGVFFP